jgi:hypothetical protein
MTIATDSFATTDLQLATFLVATGKTLLGVDGPRGRRTFRFRDVNEADRLAYFQGQPVSAIRLFESFRTLKNVIFAG